MPYRNWLAVASNSQHNLGKKCIHTNACHIHREVSMHFKNEKYRENETGKKIMAGLD